jgi:hypothetical protein
LPQPPGPMSVSSRPEASRDRTSANSRSRPTKLLVSSGGLPGRRSCATSRSTALSGTDTRLSACAGAEHTQDSASAVNAARILSCEDLARITQLSDFSLPEQSTSPTSLGLYDTLPWDAVQTGLSPKLKACQSLPGYGAIERELRSIETLHATAAPLSSVNGQYGHCRARWEWSIRSRRTAGVFALDILRR